MKTFAPYFIPAICFLFLCSLSVSAQPHIYPKNGEDGLPGTESNSFLIGWQTIPNAIGYQYVMSDNPRCFVGCSGDTRFQTVTDTFAVEFNLQQDHWYYWITRIIYVNGDTSLWSTISSFVTTGIEDSPQMITPTNPTAHEGLTLHIDWGLDPNAVELNYRLININGYEMIADSYSKPHPDLRFDRFSIPTPALPGGYYVLEVRIRRTNSLIETRQTLKLLIR